MRYYSGHKIKLKWKAQNKYLEFVNIIWFSIYLNIESANWILDCVITCPDPTAPSRQRQRQGLGEVVEGLWQVHQEEETLSKLTHLDSVL